MGILKKSRALEGVPQWQMAERMGKSIPTISSYENDEQKATLKFLCRWYSKLENEAARKYFIEALVESFG